MVIIKTLLFWLFYRVFILFSQNNSDHRFTNKARPRRWMGWDIMTHIPRLLTHTHLVRHSPGADADRANSSSTSSSRAAAAAPTTS